MCAQIMKKGILLYISILKTSFSKKVFPLHILILLFVTMLTLYTHPISQPARTVWWLMAWKLPASAFKIVVLNPGELLSPPSFSSFLSKKADHTTSSLILIFLPFYFSLFFFQVHRKPTVQDHHLSLLRQIMSVRYLH